MAHTISLTALPDGNYSILDLDEQTGKPAAPTYGPLQKNQVFHQLLILGLYDDVAEELILAADANKTAEVRGVTPKEY